MHPYTQTYKQHAHTHKKKKSKFLSFCCDTKQQKQVSLVSINCQRSSCWILALYYSWRGCAFCWHLGAKLIIAPLCCQKHDGFKAFILKDVFFPKDSDFFPFPFSPLWSNCDANQTTATPFPFFVLFSRGVIKQYTSQVKSWVKFV